MEIFNVKNAFGGTIQTLEGPKTIYRYFNGLAFYEPNKGYIALSENRDCFGILMPFSPHVGREAMQAVINTGGFSKSKGIEYVNPIHPGTHARIYFLDMGTSFTEQ